MKLIISDKEKLNKKSIIIGSWCIKNKFLFRENKNKLNVLQYHWDKKKKINKDSLYLLNLHEIYLNLLQETLNRHHKFRFSKKFYTTILTRWLWKFLLFHFDRWEQVSVAKKNKKIKASVIYDYDQINFIPVSTKDYLTNIIFQKDWNNWIFSEIIKEKNFVKHKIKKQKINFKNTYSKYTVKLKLLILTNKFLSYFSSKTFFAQNIYLPKISKFFFRLKNKQFLFSYQSDYDSLIKNDNNIDLECRKKIFNLKYNSKFTKFINKQLIYNFPKSFLENFKENIEYLKKLSLPKNPKLILTSLDHHFNDIFNLYTAIARENGSSYYVLQHGGSYGLADNFIPEVLDIKVSDKFFTWGWKDNSKKVISYYFQKYNIKKSHIFSSKNKSGIVIPTTEFNLEPGEIAGGRPRHCDQVKDYINNINEILLNLNEDIKKNVTIKYLETRNVSYVRDTINKKYSDIKFMTSKKNTYFHNFLISVETLNSTGFLEAMFLNHPVLLLLDQGYSPIRQSGKKFMNNLKTADIVHSSSESVSSFLNLNYYNIEQWWNTKKVQKIRKSFCANYLRSFSNQTLDLNEL